MSTRSTEAALPAAVAPGWREVLTSRRLGAMLVLGFASGLPLALTSGTLQAWLTVSGVDLTTIGLLTLVGLPYTLKFLWAPLMDRYVMPWLGRRRGWMVSTQLALIAAIAWLGAMDPLRAPWMIGAIAMLVAFLSASQDIAFDAYRTDLLPQAERGLGAALSVTGYRIGMLVSGAVALLIAQRLGWHGTYLLMAALMAIGVLGTLWGPEPQWAVVPPRSLKEAVWNPFYEFLSRSRAAQLLLLIVLYKLGDAFAGSLTTAFLIRGVHFSVATVGAVNKGFGLLALLGGALFGGALMTRLGLYRALMLFGLLQAVSNLSFMVLAWVGHSYPLLLLAVGFENLAGGMGTAAFVALLMTLCDHRYTATQFALLSALAAIGRVFVGPAAGVLVESVGWATFFLLTTVTALPGLVLLWLSRPLLLQAAMR